MRKDYQFLIGREFSVGGDVYVVRSVEWQDDVPVVDANCDAGNRLFAMHEVIQHLLVEEEIELFNPNWLSAVGP